MGGLKWIYNISCNCRSTDKDCETLLTPTISCDVMSSVTLMCIGTFLNFMLTFKKRHFLIVIGLFVSWCLFYYSILSIVRYYGLVADTSCVNGCHVKNVMIIFTSLFLLFLFLFLFFLNFIVYIQKQFSNIKICLKTILWDDWNIWHLIFLLLLFSIKSYRIFWLHFFQGYVRKWEWCERQKKCYCLFFLYKDKKVHGSNCETLSFNTTKISFFKTEFLDYFFMFNCFVSTYMN